MTWAQRLKRVFNIDIETCGKCGGAVKVIACIEDPVMIRKILAHLRANRPFSGTHPVAADAGPAGSRPVRLTPGPAGSRPVRLTRSQGVAATWRQRQG